MSEKAQKLCRKGTAAPTVMSTTEQYDTHAKVLIHLWCDATVRRTRVLMRLHAKVLIHPRIIPLMKLSRRDFQGLMLSNRSAFKVVYLFSH